MNWCNNKNRVDYISNRICSQRSSISLSVRDTSGTHVRRPHTLSRRWRTQARAPASSLARVRSEEDPMVRLLLPLLRLARLLVLLFCLARRLADSPSRCSNSGGDKAGEALGERAKSANRSHFSFGFVFLFAYFRCLLYCIELEVFWSLQRIRSFFVRSAAHSARRAHTLHAERGNSECESHSAASVAVLREKLASRRVRIVG